MAINAHALPDVLGQAGDESITSPAPAGRGDVAGAVRMPWPANAVSPRDVG